VSLETIIVAIIVAAAAVWCGRILVRVMRGGTRCGCGKDVCPVDEQQAKAVLRSIKATQSKDPSRGD
jgi:hypothetical protein